MAFTNNLKGYDVRYNNLEQIEARLEWVREKILVLGFRGPIYRKYREEREYLKKKRSHIKAEARKAKRRVVNRV